MIYLFLLPVALLARFFWWYSRATSKRRTRIRVRLLQKMAEKRLDEWELAKVMGVEVRFVHQLLTGNQRIDAVAASGLCIAFPETDLDYWYSLDQL